VRGGQVGEPGGVQAVQQSPPDDLVRKAQERADQWRWILAVVTPGLFGPAYFREVGEVLAAGGPPDIEAIKAVMRRNGLTPA
jgi:hypothetical protein